MNLCFSGQGRLDGAFCDYTLDDKLQYLREAYDKGVRNIEMECTTFAAMCKRANVPAAVTCVTLLDRLQGDQVILSHEQHEDFQFRPQKLFVNYLKKLLASKKGKVNSPTPRKRQKAE